MANKKKETIGIMKSAMLPGSYARVLEALKERIRQTQIKAALSVNRHLIELYWHIGKTIIERQQTDGWGKSVVERLAHDLHKGISRYRRFFNTQYLAYAGFLSGLYRGNKKSAATCGGIQRQKSATACGRNSLGAQCSIA